MADPKRPILTGYMVLDGWADDYSDWDGAITGPNNPTGANLYWHDPIPMIEKRAYDQAVKERDFASQQWRDWNTKSDALYKWGIEAHDMLHEWASRTPVESWPEGIRGLIEAFPGCDCIPHERQCGFHAAKARRPSTTVKESPDAK